MKLFKILDVLVLGLGVAGALVIVYYADTLALRLVGVVGALVIVVVLILKIRSWNN